MKFPSIITITELNERYRAETTFQIARIYFVPKYSLPHISNLFFHLNHEEIRDFRDKVSIIRKHCLLVYTYFTVYGRNNTKEENLNEIVLPFFIQNGRVY